MARQNTDAFRWWTTGVLILFVAVIAVLLLSDAAYVTGSALRDAFGSRDIRHAFVLSLWTSLAATALAVLVAVPAAYALSRYPFRGILVLDTMVDLLIVLPVLVIGLSILVFFRVGGNLAGSPVLPLQWVGHLVAGLGSLFIYTVAGIVLAQFLCSASYAIRTIKSAFDEIDPRTEQVALTLGCTRAGAFRRITLPLARHGILAGTVLAWARAFGVFGPIVIVAGAVRGKTEVLPTSIYLEVSIGRLEAALAVALIMIAVATGVLIVMRAISGRSVFGTGGSR
jgi:molybdate transport system permease protein